MLIIHYLVNIFDMVKNTVIPVINTIKIYRGFEITTDIIALNKTIIDKKIIFGILNFAANIEIIIREIIVKISKVPEKVFTNKHSKFKGSMNPAHVILSVVPPCPIK